jgi:murein DD-endopeptidase MepM/ murein hydrolase activator NlpD
MLAQLLDQLQVAETLVSAAAAAEAAALDRLAAAETHLHTALANQASFSAALPALQQQVEAARTRAQEAAAQRDALERRVEAGDGATAPRGPLLFASSRPAWHAEEALFAAEDAERQAQEELAGEQEQLASLVDQLGAANTEVTAWQKQAEILAEQVGAARSRALAANAQLAQIKQQGDQLATTVWSEFQALVSAGYPVGVARIVGGPMPIAEPVAWPASVPGYAIPTGRVDTSLLASAPLFIDKSRLETTGLAGSADRWQAPVHGPVTTPFGDGTPYQDAHYAVDIGARLYTPVVAAADGVVEYAGLAATDNRLASYGLVVLVRHDDHVTTLYAHLDDQAYGLAVATGATVTKGQIIGYVGLTGYTTGPHLHFEVRIDNRPIDPLLLVSP